MNQPIKIHYLYCPNVQCRDSIHNRMTEFQIPFTAKDQPGVYTCDCCNQPLVTAIDMATKHVMVEAGRQKPNNVSYLYN